MQIRRQSEGESKRMLAVIWLSGLLVQAVSVPIPEDGSVMDRIWKAQIAPNSGLATDGISTQLIEMDIVNTARLQAEIKALQVGVLQDAISDSGYQWPKGVVPYVISGTANAQLHQAFLEAVAEYNARTCVRFVPRGNEADYVNVFAGSGCYSYIGRQGAKQDISLGSGCEYKGIAIHEMMHALGFFHEQSRRDRDSYISVQFQNIISGMSHNFDMYQAGVADTLGEPYDKQSVMHYGNYAFSSNGQKTIVSLTDPNEVLGQRNGLSDIDVRQISIRYQCGSVTRAPATTASITATVLTGTATKSSTGVPQVVATKPLTTLLPVATSKPTTSIMPPVVSTKLPTSLPPFMTTKPTVTLILAATTKPPITVLLSITTKPPVTTLPPVVTTRVLTTMPPAVTAKPIATTSIRPTTSQAPVPATTTQAPVTTLACTDDYPFCYELDTYCTQGWVSTICRSTCKLCKARCVDAILSCWSMRRFCDNATYVDYMRINCKATCGWC